MKKVTFQFSMSSSDSAPIRWSDIPFDWRNSKSLESCARFVPDFGCEERPMPIVDYRVLALNFENVDCHIDKDELLFTAHPTVIFLVDDSVPWDPRWFTRTIWGSQVALEIPGVNDGDYDDPYYIQDGRGHSCITAVTNSDSAIRLRRVRFEMSDVTGNCYLPLPDYLRTTEFLHDNLQLGLDFYSLDNHVHSWSVVDPGLDAVRIVNGTIVNYPSPTIEFVTDFEGSDREFIDGLAGTEYRLCLTEDLTGGGDFEDVVFIAPVKDVKLLS